MFICVLTSWLPAEATGVSVSPVPALPLTLPFPLGDGCTQSCGVDACPSNGEVSAALSLTDRRVSS